MLSLLLDTLPYYPIHNTCVPVSMHSEYIHSLMDSYSVVQCCRGMVDWCWDPCISVYPFTYTLSLLTESPNVHPALKQKSSHSPSVLNEFNDVSHPLDVYDEHVCSAILK